MENCRFFLRIGLHIDRCLDNHGIPSVSLSLRGNSVGGRRTLSWNSKHVHSSDEILGLNSSKANFLRKVLDIPRDTTIGIPDFLRDDYARPFLLPVSYVVAQTVALNTSLSGCVIHYTPWHVPDSYGIDLQQCPHGEQEHAPPDDHCEGHELHESRERHQIRDHCCTDTTSRSAKNSAGSARDVLSLRAVAHPFAALAWQLSAGNTSFCAMRLAAKEELFIWRS